MKFIKNTRPYVLVVILCAAAYFIRNKFLVDKIVEKEVVYTSDKASEVEMAWGINYFQLPAKQYLPEGSLVKNGLVYSKMIPGSNGNFTLKLQLPEGSELNYYAVLSKDKNGNDLNVWDTGGYASYYLYFSNNRLFRLGYFIFLAGFLCMLIHFLKNKKSLHNVTVNKIFTLKEYIPQFDSIRAIAVILVILVHWLPEDSFLNFLPNGPLGVNIFFVLSGFLITGILLKAKLQVEEQGLKLSSVFKNFYIRRTLRIFPIYYLYLFIFWILDDPGIKEYGIWYFTYTSNLLLYFKEFSSQHLGHLWSLAVEEQFYIFWPCLIILLNKKYLPYLFWLLLTIGISSNYIFIDHHWRGQMFTPVCFDAFSIGGFLSYLTIYRHDIIQSIQSKYKWIFTLVLCVFMASVFKYHFLPQRTIHSLLAAVIIYYCLFKRNIWIMNLVLDNRWLIRIGKISYGMYLYHFVIPELWGLIVKKFASRNIDLLFNASIPEAYKPGWLFIQHFSLLIVICFLSWKLIEKPINNLKKKFDNKNTLPKQYIAIQKADPKASSY